MKSKKWILVLSAVACFVLAGVLIAIGVKNGSNEHTHAVVDAKEYHIGGESVYYTQSCKCGEYDERTDTDLTINEVFASVAEQDIIVLDDDVILEDSIALNGFAGNLLTGMTSRNLVVNLDLRGHNFESSATPEMASGNALFLLNAGGGEVRFNVKNGKLDAGQLKYVAKLTHNENNQVAKLTVNLNNVECCVNSSLSATIFADENLNGGVITATGCKFVANSPNQSENGNADCFGVLINSNSQFIFNNCYFEGGDAVYVRRGQVSFNECKLLSNSNGKTGEALSGDVITSMGSCLVLDCNASTTGEKTTYNVKLVDCYLDALGKPNKKSMFVGCSAETGAQYTNTSEDCVIEIKNCKFSTDIGNIPQVKDVITSKENVLEENSGEEKRWFKIN